MKPRRGMFVNVVLALLGCAEAVDPECAHLSGGARLRCGDLSAARTALAALGDCTKKAAAERSACVAERARLEEHLAEIEGVAAPQQAAEPASSLPPASAPTVAPSPAPVPEVGRARGAPMPTFEDQAPPAPPKKSDEETMEAEDDDE